MRAAPVDGKGGNAAIFGDFGDGGQVLMVVVPTQTGFEGNGYARRLDHRLQNGGNQRLVLHQRATGLDVAHFLGGAAHIDVDDLRPESDVVTRRIRHLFGVAAGNLHGNDAAFIGKITAVQGFSGIPERRIAGQHFAHRPTCAKRPTEAAEGFVGNARHRRKCDGVVDKITADVHNGPAFQKSAPLYIF